MENKVFLRIDAKNTRKNLLMSAISERAVEYIRMERIYKNSENVMIFYPTKNEINLLSLLSDYKQFYLPRVKGDDLEVCPYSVGDELNKSDFNISEPLSEVAKPETLDLVIVPALMADEEGFRLGYGGGFYDRFLASCPDSVKTITVIPKELFVKELPHEEFDIKIDRIICA